MKNLFRGISLGVWLALLGTSAHGAIRKVRITEFSDPRNYTDIWNIVGRELGATLGAGQFAIAEQINLRGMMFLHLAQVRGGAPVEGAALRLWISNAGDMLVAEGFIDVETNTQKSRSNRARALRYLSPTYLNDDNELHAQELKVRAALREHSDPAKFDFAHEDRWKGDDFQRVFTAQGRRGVHMVRFSHVAQEVVEHVYQEFAKAQELDPVAAVAFKIWEENQDNIGELMEAEPVTLKYLNAQAFVSATDPLAPVTGRSYSLFENAETLARFGAPADFATWSFAALQQQLDQLVAGSSAIDNGFTAPEGLVMDGRFVSVSVHPEARAQFMANVEFPWRYNKTYTVKQSSSTDGIPHLQLQTNLRGKTFRSAEELQVAPVRHASHSVVEAVQSGTDQVQVYWAVTEMMEQLQRLGFTDPELSTRPFQAILYDPDQGLRDNAFYINNTINFTTYSPQKPNFARDNTTIWHELGHGIVDRLMGPALVAAKSAGFNEGIPDFIAELILQATSFQRDFPGRAGQRIYNNKPFNLFNETHKAGEAFGAVMKGILDQAIGEWGEEGVAKTADLLLEAMRFSRNHPALDEQEWIEKLRYVDGRGSPVRGAGEFASFIDASLRGRNFTSDGQNLAKFDVEIEGRQLADNVMSAGAAYPQTLGAPKDVMFKVRLADGSDFRFTYPLRVVIESGFGALLGIDWVGEETQARRELIIAESNAEASTTLRHLGQCDLLHGTNGCADVLSIKVFEPNSATPVVSKSASFAMTAPTLVPLARR